MRLSYLLLCDAASAAEGKLNLLGIGVRSVRLNPASPIANLALVGAIEGLTTESQPQRLLLTLTEPDGTVTTLADQPEARLPQESAIADVPVQLLVMVNLTRPYSEPGRYTFRLAYGSIAEDYVFVVEHVSQT